MGAYKGKMSPPKKKTGGGTSDTDSIEGENDAKHFSGVSEKNTKPNYNLKISGEKVQFNPAVHSIKNENKYKSKNRFRKREKQKK